MPTRVILDVDTGTDDAVALLVAARSPDLDLIGVTTVVGNCPNPVATENTLRVFDAAGITDVPVYAGMQEPLVRPDFDRGAPSFQDIYLPLPEATSRAQEEHAVHYLIRTFMQSDGDITLIPVGPLTNVAAAIRMEPRLVRKIPRLAIMGGGHDVGNVTPSAEFNIWADPEAARVVFRSGIPITLLPLDATHQALVGAEDIARLRQIGTRAAAIAAAVTEIRLEAYNATQPMRKPGNPVHDALTVCAVIDPTIIRTEHIHVDVEVCGELTAGRTVCDFHHRGKGVPNADVAIWADEGKFIQMLETILGRPE